VFFLGAIVGAPLLAGAVHRPTLIVMMGFAGAALVGLWGSVRHDGRRLRISSVVLLPLTFLVIAGVQSIPLPVSLRGVLDPTGTSLLADHALVAPSAWPLSLDPSSTRAHIGKAAAALAIFLVAYHLASGQRRRYLAMRVIGAAGIAAVVVGIGHKIAGLPKIYGILKATHRSLLTGPFVNTNHTAELLELAAFACLACSFQRPTALNRVGWMVGMVFCVGGAAATLSRGAMLGMVMGVLMFGLLYHHARDLGEREQRRRRMSLAWTGILLVLIVASAAALGAGQIIERFRSGSAVGDVRFQLWRNSLSVFAAHPLGIGRGAFDRVFPVYRTFTTPLPVRFDFVENQPLQLLIDSGVIAFALVCTGVAYVVRRLIREGRRDRIEAALVAGMLAVLVHNLVDFGLETLGVLLPFMAMLGTTLGRSAVAEQRTLTRTWPIGVAVGAGLVVGLASIIHASYDDFDSRIAAAANPVERKSLLVQAQRVHPVDYYYPLTFARLEPLRGPVGTPSPRFRALNRALGLCPGCESVHVEVARNLWALGLRSQSLLEWRTAVNLQPGLLRPTLSELFAAGAKAEELASVAISDPNRIIEVAAFLGSLARVDEAEAVLGQAEALGVAEPEVLLTRAKLQLQARKLDAASATLSRAHQKGVRDARLAVLDAQLSVDQKGPSGVDGALATLDDAAARSPGDLAVQRMRFELVMRFEKWQKADRALEGFKQALYQCGGSVAEAHIAAARMHARLSRWTAALGEFRIALSDEPGNAGLWMEYGRTAEAAGRLPTAREAYAQAARLSPNDPGIASAVRVLQQRETELRRTVDLP
jgi:Flp pilus assembly protein TadD